MKVGDQVTMSDEDLKWWPELKDKKLVIWYTEPGFVYIKIGKKKDYHRWDKIWFKMKRNKVTGGSCSAS